MSFAPSEQQQAVIDFAVANPSTNVAITALAGSGKTTTLVAIAKAKPRHHSGVAVAFARPNALDFKEVMPINIESGTLHSFGLRALNSWNGKTGVDKNKIYKIADKHEVTIRKDFPALPKVIGFAKAQGLVPLDTLPKDFVCSRSAIHTYLEDTTENWMRIFERMGAESETLDEDEMIEVCRKVLADSILWALKAQKPTADFDDMIYLPACFSDGEGLPRPKLLLVDEAQDLNFTQHACIRFMGSSPATQVIIVGDPNQGIYAFRGADANSFRTLINEFDCVEFDLSFTFRSDKAITREAQSVVVNFDTFSKAEGEVKFLGKEWDPSMVQVGDSVLCRNNLPLVAIFYRFIAEGKPAKIKGSEIGKGLITILRTKITGNDVRSIRNSILDWEVIEYNKALKLGYNAKAGLIIEKSGILQAVLQRQIEVGVKQRQVKDAMIADLNHMFTDEVPKITLSTIHKAKGLEWDRVWFLDDWLIPSRYARQEWELKQEQNLLYVGITRAKHSLFYIDSGTPHGKKA